MMPTTNNKEQTKMSNQVKNEIRKMLVMAILLVLSSVYFLYFINPI
jgi:cell division protein FtsB